jgi:RluA family pseudouridine synthase
MDIIYQDNDIIAINKPAGVSVTHDRGGSESLIEMIQRKPGYEDTLVIHRLDKDTSGIMIFAKNAESHRRYCQIFEESQARKIYLALVTGRPDEDTGEIDAPIMQSKKDALKMAVDMQKGKESQTRWQLLADFGRLSLVAARPLTGRTHQIRVHFQYAGFPLAIDPLYSGNEPIMLSAFKSNYRLGKYAEEKPLIERLTLCAYELEIENHHFIAPLEKKFKATIKMLTKYSSKGHGAFLNEKHFEEILDSKSLSLDI